MTSRPHLRPAAAALLVASAAFAAGCAGRTAPRSPAASGTPGVVPDVQRLYQGMGLIAGSGAIPFVGSVSFFRAPSTDSTLTLLALSLPARSLAFTREGDRYSAAYNARVEIRRDGNVVRVIDAAETVRVPTFRETTRTDESVIWQQFLRLAPGSYVFSVSLRDPSGIRTSTEEVAVEVPRYVNRSLSTPVPVYEAIPRASIDSLPRILRDRAAA